MLQVLVYTAEGFGVGMQPDIDMKFHILANTNTKVPHLAGYIWMSEKKILEMHIQSSGKMFLCFLFEVSLFSNKIK